MHACTNMCLCGCDYKVLCRGRCATMHAWISDCRCMCLCKVVISPRNFRYVRRRPIGPKPCKLTICVLCTTKTGPSLLALVYLLDVGSLMFDDFWESYKAPGDEASSRNPFETIMRALGHSTPRNFEETQPQVAAHGSQSVNICCCTG